MAGPRRTAQQIDWRSAAAYDYTERLPRPGWAWEFLRRNPKYRAAYAKADRRALHIQRRGPDLTVITMEEEQPNAEDWSVMFF